MRAVDLVGDALSDTRRLIDQARRTRKTLKAFEHRVLGAYELAAGEPITSEVLDLLRLAVDGHQQEVVIVVLSAGDTHSQPQAERNDHAAVQRQGAAREGRDRRGDIGGRNGVPIGDRHP